MPDKVRKFIYEMQYNFVILHLVKSAGNMNDINRSNIEAFLKLIETADRPVIVTHAKPDGDAMGSALVKLRADGRVYSGNGISTDIIGASIRAYLSALNKIIYEES